MKKLVAILSLISNFAYAGQVCITAETGDYLESNIYFHTASEEILIREYIEPFKTFCAEIPADTKYGAANVFNAWGDTLCYGIVVTSPDDNIQIKITQNLECRRD